MINGFYTDFAYFPVGPGKNYSIPVTGKFHGKAGDEGLFVNSLDSRMDYDSIFEVVKESVRYVTGKARSGIGLALSDLPSTLGAYWQVGGNYIVMNENLVRAMLKLSGSEREFNSFIYMILAHEYIHSLGYIDEMEAREMTAKVARAAFGEKHHAARMSAGDVWNMYPQLKYAGSGNGSSLRIVSKFDSSATSYIA
ncbi:MAG: hypothetical protein M1301_04925 [Candidatus Thermoplasmatota archaeon]|jgi:hypothetical protein|nr:hypothetical protein [Candidatus Thermoplasmatota archaeon]